MCVQVVGNSARAAGGARALAAAFATAALLCVVCPCSISPLPHPTYPKTTHAHKAGGGGGGAGDLDDPSLQAALAGFLAKAEQHRADMGDGKATVEHLVRLGLCVLSLMSV